MNFASDNVAGASPRVLDALVKANSGALAAYGADPITGRVEGAFADVFEHEVAVSLVATGTAANALALAALVPPWGLAVCHAEAHVTDDECGAPEFFMHGGKLAGLPGVGGKIEAGVLDAYLGALPKAVKQMPPKALSLSQATEAGQVYTLEEIAALSAVAHAHGLKVHMDGARFVNALIALGCAPADMTWRAGVDVLSFGATKNGCLAAEAVVFFDPALAETMAYRRKRAGHTLSKGRLIAAQFEGYFAEDHWLDLGRRANAAAADLSSRLARLPGVRLAWPVPINEVFAIVPRTLDRAMRAAGAVYHPWSTGSLPPGEAVGPDEVLIRLVTSFATQDAEIDRLIEAATGGARVAAQ